VRRWGPAAALEPATEPRAGKRPNGHIVVIGTSTGGPAALRRLLTDLPGAFPAPILVVQHIARGFVDGLANWLGGGCPLRVKVATEAEELLAGTVYLAPDEHHLGVTSRGRVALSDGTPIGGFRPSITHLFRSAARNFNGATVAALLTGMGSDGVEGLRTVRAAGGRILLQDEASSVVFGMAQEALKADLADSVLSIDRIGPRLVELVS
jgi:two-component system, chemotaxis family, protein-glutamate methylesterase/glutaminase